MDSAQRAGEKDALALYSGTSGLREVWFGNPDEAGDAHFGIEALDTRDALYFGALALAYSRDDAQAKRGRRSGQEVPEDTLVQFNYLPSLRGKLALNKEMLLTH